MNKEEIMQYVGDLEIEIEEIRQLEKKVKDSDLGSSITKACSSVLTIICC